MDELLAIAEMQHSIFTRAQAHRCGVTNSMLQYRVRIGLLEQLPRGVYRVEGTERTWHQRVLAACLSGGHECVASHRTAAALHGFDGARPGLIEVTVPRRLRYKHQDVVVHQSLDLSATDRTVIGVIPVTTPARTLIDLGAVRPWQRVEEAFDSAERDALVLAEHVARRHSQVRKRGRRGVGPMAVVLDGRLDVVPKYVIERRFLRVLASANLPRPACQYELALPSGRPAYLDAAYVDLRLGWELDGHGSHATRQQRADDNRRAAEIADLGWQLRRFTWEQVMRESAAVVRQVRSAIRSRSCGL